MRSKGSARFVPYFKVQVWEDRSCAWTDVQRGFGAVEDARAAFVPGRVCRVVEITESGRRVMG